MRKYSLDVAVKALSKKFPGVLDYIIYLVFKCFIEYYIKEWGLMCFEWGLLCFDWGLLCFDWGLMCFEWGLI